MAFFACSSSALKCRDPKDRRSSTVRDNLKPGHPAYSEIMCQIFDRECILFSLIFDWLRDSETTCTLVGITDRFEYEYERRVRMNSVPVGPNASRPQTICICT